MLYPFYQSANLLECGLDEAGRGSLVGSVVAAAVIFPKGYSCEMLNDSKQLTEKKRRDLRKLIEDKALCIEVSFVGNEDIDKINILNASFLAMNIAVESLSTKPELLLVDGNRFKTDLNIPYKCIVKGDAKYQSIAAASILAKTYRDEYMEQLSEQYPQYNWHKNKGYPTKEHRQAIRRYGISPYHRKSFDIYGELLLFSKF